MTDAGNPGLGIGINFLLSDPALGGDRGVAICHETVPDSIGDPPISPSTPMRPIPGVPKLER